MHAAAELEARPLAVAPVSDARSGELELAEVPVFVPATYHPDRPAGVLVMLHGAGGTSQQALGLVQHVASDENLIIVAPKSHGSSWDVVRDGFGPDVATIDAALGAVFAAYAIDPARIAIGGFSDGASYALTLGLANGDLFRAILAFSPGFELAPRRRGSPRVFIAHGTGDTVLPIRSTSHRLVSALEDAGMNVTYYEFDGGHAVPAEALRRAFAIL